MPYLKSVVLFAAIVVPSVLHAQTKAPDSLSFQGRLTSPGGVPIDTPSVSITFKLYDDGSEVWTETHPAVTVEGGVFNVILGGSTPLNSMAFNRPLELGITVGGDSEISPRTPLTSAAYAKALPGLYTYFISDGGYESHNVVGGSTSNFVGPGAVGATIGGGGARGVVVTPNSVLGLFGTVSGGIANAAEGDASTVGGGNLNVASALVSTISGGGLNVAKGRASTVGGGEHNQAKGRGSTVPGGDRNHAHADYSLTAGYNAKAHHEGSFVWNDRSQTAGNFSDSLYTTGVNQFLIRAAGGVGIGTNAPSSQLSVVGNVDISDSLAIGSTVTEAPIHVLTQAQGVDSEEAAREGIIVEKADAIIGAYSSNAGTYGSGLVLAEMASDNLVSKWAMVRETNSAGNDLHFKYGSDDLYENNATQFEIRNTGEAVTGGDLLPGTDNAYSLGTGSLVWTEVYAASGVVSTSDRRLKEDVRELSLGLDEVMQLEPVTYRRRDRPDDPREIGLIAQDVESVVPLVVRPPADESETYGLNYAQMVPLLIKAIQQQQTRINALEEIRVQSPAFVRDTLSVGHGMVSPPDKTFSNGSRRQRNRG